MHRWNWLAWIRRRAAVARRGGVRNRRRWLTYERLETRLASAITATFFSSPGLLEVRGDALDNTIEVGRDAVGNLLVNGGAIVIQGGPATIVNTVRIQISGGNGNDTLTANAAAGPLPRAYLLGATATISFLEATAPTICLARRVTTR